MNLSHTMTGIVGVFSDLHGDLAALKLLLLREPEVSQWICVGDLVDFRDEWPNVIRAVAFAREHGVFCLLGNHEEVLATAHTTDLASKDAQQFLYELPEHLEVSLGHKTIYCCHATPSSNKRRCSVLNEPKEGLLATFAGVESDIIIYGHTHEAGIRQIGRRQFVNTGHLGTCDLKTAQTYVIVSNSGEVLLKTLAP